MVAEFLEGVDACEVWAVCVSVCAGTREAGSDGPCGQKDSIQTQLELSGFAEYGPLNPFG